VERGTCVGGNHGFHENAPGEKTTIQSVGFEVKK
jgi:hypothetical protein